MPQDKKFKSQRQYRWPDAGHSLNLYVNAYLNVPVAVDSFKTYIAAGLRSVADDLEEEAQRERTERMRVNMEKEAMAAPITTEEEKEVRSEEKYAEKEQARLEKRQGV